MTAQQENLERVAARLRPAVTAFCREHDTFHMKELTDYVGAQMPGAPDSAGRILRLLKKEGRVNYRVLNRAASLYQIEREPYQAPLFGGQS